jgi:aminopeptidase N
MKRLFLLALFFPLLLLGNRNIYGQNAQYDLSVKILPEAHHLEASGTMQLLAADKVRGEFRLSLSELMRNFTVEIIEPATSAGIAKVEKAETSRGSVKWVVRPVRPIPVKQTVKLRFSYAGGEQIANQFYIGPEVSFASAYGTDWYPLIDEENDKGTGWLRFSVPAGHKVYATGKGHSSNREAEQETFKFEIIHPTYFAFAAGNYSVVRRNGSVPVAIYTLRPHKNIEQYLDGISRILVLLSQEFGPYRFGEFTLIEVPNEQARKAQFSGAAFQGFFFSSSAAIDAPEFNLALPYFSHEISHEWFPHVTALKKGGGRFTEEALAQYGSLRVVEAIQGAAVAEQYRRTGLPNYNAEFSAAGYFKIAASGADQKLADLKGEPGRLLAYTKGFLVFDMLSREIGRKRFQRILQNITRQYAFKEITWSEFLQMIETGAGRNLRWFFEQWFERTGAPDYQLTWKQEGKQLRGEITQPAPYFRAALEVEIKGKGRRLLKRIEVVNGRTEFNLRVPFKVDSVVLDPEYKVLRWLPEFRK